MPVVIDLTHLCTAVFQTMVLLMNKVQIHLKVLLHSQGLFVLPSNVIHRTLSLEL